MGLEYKSKWPKNARAEVERQWDRQKASRVTFVDVRRKDD